MIALKKEKRKKETFIWVKKVKLFVVLDVINDQYE